MSSTDFTITIPASLAVTMSDDNITSDPSMSAALAELVTKSAVTLNQIFTTNSGLTALKRTFASQVVDIRELLAETKDAAGMAAVARDQIKYIPLVRAIYAKAGIIVDNAPGSIQSGIRGYISEELVKRGYKSAPAVLTEAQKAEAATKRVGETVAKQTPEVLAAALGQKLAGDATNPGSAVDGVYAVDSLLQAVRFNAVTEEDRDAVHASLVELGAHVARLVARFAPAVPAAA